MADPTDKPDDPAALGGPGHHHFGEGENPRGYHCQGKHDINGNPDPDGPHKCGCGGYIGDGKGPCVRSFEVESGPGGDAPARLTCHHGPEWHYSII
jgi:hypothetical protein